MQDLRSHYTTQKPPLTRSRIPPDTTPLPYGAVVPTVRAYKVYHRHDREQKPTYVTRSGKLHVRVSTIVEYWHSVGIPGDYVTSFAKDKRTLTTQDCLSAFQKLLAVCRDSQGDEGTPRLRETTGLSNGHFYGNSGEYTIESCYSGGLPYTQLHDLYL